MISILDEALSIDRRASHDMPESLRARIVALATYAETTGAEGVLFTCSAFGGAIEEADRQSVLPIMKPNEAMFDAALACGDRVAMIYTFPPAAGGMEEEFRQAALAGGHNARLSSYFCEDALEAKQAGHHAEHDRLIARTAQQIEDADVIMLAQFSMADAAEEVRKHCAVPVLSSPDAAVTEMRRRVEAQARVVAC